MRNIDEQALHLAYKLETGYDWDYDSDDYYNWLQEKVTQLVEFNNQINRELEYRLILHNSKTREQAMQEPIVMGCPFDEEAFNPDTL